VDSQLRPTVLPQPSEAARPSSSSELEFQLARLITAGTYVSVVLLGIGLVAMVLRGVSPLAAAPRLDPATLPGDLLAGRPEAFLWLGVIAVIVTPTLRVIAALAGFVRLQERPMIGVALAVLGVIVLSVVVALLAEA
jgi:uncharacterized membrane protein